MAASFFELANIFAAFVGFFFLALKKHSGIKYWGLLFLIYIISVCSLLAVWVSIGVSLNILLLSFSLYLFYRPGQLKNEDSPSYSPTRLGWVVISFLFSAPFFLKDTAGWTVVLFGAVAYWFLFVCANLFELTNNRNLKSIIGFLVFSAGLLWQFKLALLMGAVIILFQLFNSSSVKKSLTLFVVFISFVFLVAYFQYDQIELFLYKSVLRPDYDLDVKVLGFSDGGRVNLWHHYVENSAFLGKGQYHMPDIVPTHNIFIHLIHEFGFLGFFLIAPVFFYLILRIAKNNSFVVFCLIFTTLGYSSVGEFPVFWVPCIVLARLLISLPFFTRPR